MYKQSYDPSYRIHKRQIFWPVFLPVFLAVLLLLAAGVLAGMGTFTNAADGTRWAGIAIIWMIIPAFLAGGVFLVLLGFMSYGLARLLRITPTYSLIARAYIFKAAFFVRRWSDRVAEPVIKPKVAWAGLGGFFSSLKNALKNIR